MCQDFLSKKILRKRGYTLIEVVISIMFFAIISLGLSLPFSSSISLTVDDRNINVASNLARSYLKDTESSWKTQNSFDQGELIALNNTYTNNNKYTVTVNSQNISSDVNGNVLVRRISIRYKDNKERDLADIFYDYNRPGSI